MDNIGTWIDNIISDLVDESKKLSDTLLKVQVLSHKLANSQLSQWVKDELNGYQGNSKNIPSYRNVQTIVRGNLIQNRGFGGMLTFQNHQIPIEYISDEKIRKRLTQCDIINSISELEYLLNEKKGKLMIPIPHPIISLINDTLGNNFFTNDAWQEISPNFLRGILSSIKSHLLNFLLTLNDSITNDLDFSIMKNKKQIDDLFKKTIGNISAHTVNLSMGDSSPQMINSGEVKNANIQGGKNNIQNNTAEIKDNTKEIVDLINKLLEDPEISKDDFDDLSNQVTILNSQLSRDTPKIGIISSALSCTKNILTGITANIITPVILDKINQVLGCLNI